MIQEVIVIGSGPAAWTALLYLARAQMKPVVYTGQVQGGARGGQLTLTTEVENYPGFPTGITGPELMVAMEMQVRNYDVTFVEEDVLEVDLSKKPFVVRGTNTYMQTNSIIVCTGAYAKRLDGVTGDIEFWGKGVSACAVCDGALPLFRNKELAVIGGGDSACEEAIFLTKFASKVYLVLRRNEFRASKIMAERVKNHKKIEIVFNHVVNEIRGDGLVNSLLLKNSDSLETMELKVSGVFYGLGHNPSTGFLKGQVELDQEGYVVRKNGTSQTSVEGVFVAGDVTDKRYKQAITAAGMGCMAALDMEKWKSELESAASGDGDKSKAGLDKCKSKNGH